MLETSERKVMFTQEQLNLIIQYFSKLKGANERDDLFFWGVVNEARAMLESSPHVGESEEADE